MILFSTSSFLLSAAEDGETWSLLREKISKLVDVQTLESKERSDWQLEKAEFSAQLEVYGKEMALLSEEITKSGQSALPHDETVELLKEELKALKEKQRLVLELVSKNLPRTLELSKQFPDPLFKECEQDLANLKAMKSQVKAREGLQTILSLWNKVDQFNRRMTRSKDVRANQEYDVIYLGLSRAFYLDSKGGAGVGVPGTEGWKWTERKELRPEIEAIYEMLDQKRSPAWVKLPLEIR